jgi:GNAT superfamily N-acetyltransferase
MNFAPVRKEWDSAFFGFPVGTVSLPQDVCLHDLRHAMSEWVEDGYELIYVFSDEPLARGVREALAAGGAQAFGTRVVYRKEYGSRTVVDDKHHLHIAATKTPALENLAYESGLHSRFMLDERLRPSFKRLYGIWLDKEIATGQVFVFPSGESPVGMATISLNAAGEAHIGLVAVDAARRGEGVASRLLADIDAWLCRKGVPSCEVVTQGANTAARALYEKAGFRQVSETTVWHLWRQTQKERET